MINNPREVRPPADHPVGLKPGGALKSSSSYGLPLQISEIKFHDSWRLLSHQGNNLLLPHVGLRLP